MLSSTPERETQILPNNFLRSFACRFVDKVTDALPIMVAACETRDFEEVASRSHWVKGTGGTVGLTELSTLAENCEAAARDSQEDQILGIIHEMEDYLALVQAERTEIGC
jgi:HPt (histidine-containing phosphotransfer) domain-containing protein